MLATAHIQTCEDRREKSSVRNADGPLQSISGLIAKTVTKREQLNIIWKNPIPAHDCVYVEYLLLFIRCFSNHGGVTIYRGIA